MVRQNGVMLRGVDLKLLGGSKMSKWGNRASVEGSVEAMDHLREQNDEFCRRMRAAIERGIESCPTVVSTAPSTQRPILGYQRPD